MCATRIVNHGSWRVLWLPLDSRRASTTPTHYALHIPTVAVADLIRRPARRVVALEGVVSRQARRVLLKVVMELVNQLVFAEVIVSATTSVPRNST